MAMRRGTARRPGPVVAPRRLTAWDDRMLNQTLADNSQDVQALMVNIADPEKRGCTLIRTLVHMQYLATNPGTVSGVNLVHFGMALVSDDAFAASIVPDTETGDDFPVMGWVFRDQISVVDETLATGPIPPVDVRLDLRSARKLDRSTLVWIAKSVSREGTVFAVQQTGIVRCLYKLP